MFRRALSKPLQGVMLPFVDYDWNAILRISGCLTVDSALMVGRQ